MSTATASRARFVAANLAVIVAVIHLGLGTLYWIRWLSIGFLVPRDLRWPLFVVSGLAILAGVFLAGRGVSRTPLYAGGIGLMVGYVVGYFWWHLSGHRPLMIVGPRTVHEQPLAQLLIAHLFAGPVEFLAIVTEVALAVVLGYLLLVGDD